MAEGIDKKRDVGFEETPLPDSLSGIVGVFTLCGLSIAVIAVHIMAGRHTIYPH